MRAAISEDWTGEPPGELMASATAAGRLRRKARSSTGARTASERPAPAARPTAPMVPVRRTTATTGRRGERKGTRMCGR